MMTDEEIISLCESYITVHRSMSVHWVLTRNGITDAVTIRRIRNKILENHIYELYGKPDRNNDTRIKIKAQPPEKWRERHWLLYDIIKAGITAAFTLLIGLPIFQLRCQQKDPISSQSNRPPAPKIDSTSTPQTHKTGSASKIK